MDSKKIESKAVICVQTYINQSDILSHYIDQNDRTPIWDGSIQVKWKNETTSTVPIQVKGKTIKKLPRKASYPISRTYLKNYCKDGGVAYFVVFIIGDESYLYYSLLTPMNLKRYIENSNGQAQISVPLSSINNKNIHQFETEFKNFDINRKRQSSYADLKPMSLDEALKKGHKINITLSDFENEEKALEYIITNPTYLYAQIESGDKTSFYPIGYEAYSLVAMQTIMEPVSIDGRVFYDDYTKTVQADSINISIGDCLSFKVERQNWQSKGQLNFNRSSESVSIISKQLKFIETAMTKGYIKIGELVINVKDENNSLSSIRNEISSWERIKELFQLLHISLDLNISKFSKKDFGNIDLLISALLDKNDIKQSRDINKITTMDLGDYTILLYTEKLENGMYHIEDFFVGAKKLAFAYNDDEDHKLATSMFSLVFNHNNYSSFINIDYSLLVNSYNEIRQYNPFITDRANNDMLMILNAFDKAEDKKCDMLQAALDINNWIIKTNDKNHELNIVNNLQIIRRMREFTDDESERLYELAESNEIDTQMQVAIQLLLDNQKAAEHYFNRLGETEKSFFMSLPIYHFWK